MTNIYLKSSEIIDWNHFEIIKKAHELKGKLREDVEISRKCFEFVRDKIFHSYDYKKNPVTLKASDVPHYKTGYCYAKSHLLAALLRANSIPSGLCYQRLLQEEGGNSFCLHGLNAVYLKDYGWYRADPRGNRADVIAEFSPPEEKIAFNTSFRGEADLPEIWADPLPVVIEVLSTYENYYDVNENLPDIDLITS